MRDGSAKARRQPERAIDADQARMVAREARRIADTRGTPQDIEWAIDDDGSLWILQARPMTALPPDVSWIAPAPGAYTRMLRFGEWIAEPVTPLFESWLLSAMEERMHAWFREQIGQIAPRPYHVVVNGWYFYSINFISGGALLRSLPGMLATLVRTPRHLAGVIPPTVRHSVPITERMWRDDMQPRYRAAVADAERRVEGLAVADLPVLIDELAALAGEYFGSIAALSGAAYKLEMNLAQFYRRHLAGTLGGSHLPLLAGFESAPDAARPCDRVARLVAPAAPARAGDGPAAEPRPGGRGEGGGRGGRGRGAGPLTASLARLQASPGRRPARRPDPRGAGQRADDRLAGAAAGGAPHRRGAGGVRGDRRGRRRLLPHPG